MVHHHQNQLDHRDAFSLVTKNGHFLQFPDNFTNDYLFIPVKISLKLFIFKSGILHGNITVIMIIIVFNYPFKYINRCFS